eukprot:CAMPEP_0177303064 /NCGR_PEP_ID=MMETSP0368-20130122/5934_1 /TAXON_ID=447022 ORGANISM="Scrippsiella hangoei-like, Strain SHHI-4" /NCGR_SAMPLE_ID=MMETSP0368 /ASSEMBLY_ACC=CAM_ASM_000363 /LENGTH=109 /DNA_ID=CAMNT_0018761587 /DNA_START=30 /DNA_END=360 /DNA_ORIENTATION=-
MSGGSSAAASSVPMTPFSYRSSTSEVSSALEDPSASLSESPESVAKRTFFACTQHGQNNFTTRAKQLVGLNGFSLVGPSPSQRAHKAEPIPQKLAPIGSTLDEVREDNL